MTQLKKLQGLFVLGVALALSVGCASRPQLKVDNMQLPTVGEASPDKSFWKDTVTYPFPVKYAKAKDQQGTEWEIAYMDEYAGKPEDRAKAKVLVLVHGKGANAGYWAEVMKAGLESGLRVVAFDIPHYGKSIPGNLDKPWARTLKDTREAAHELLVNQLGIKKATYVGHSLGGGWVMAYSLEYPQAVEKLVVAGAGHFEAYPATIKLPGLGDVDWLNPAWARDLKKWEETWEPWSKRLANDRAKTAEDIRLFNYFKRKDPKTGEIVDSKLGFYKTKTPITEYDTKARIGMINGPKREYESWIYANNRDVYAQGIEMRADDPKSVPNRLADIKQPMLILFGEEEPFLPATAVTGKSDLRLEYIKPAHKVMTAAGNEPLVKFYKGVGHFIHTDIPVQFSKDVIDFVYDGRVEGTENPANYQAPALKLPDDIAAFFKADQEAVYSKNVDRVMANYSKDYKDSSQFGTYAAIQAAFTQYADVLAQKWEVTITDLQIDGNIATLDGRLVNAAGANSLTGAKLIKEDGRWKWWGNRK